MNTPLIKATALSIGYATGGTVQPIHPPLHFELHRGEMVCLVGPNGCGKSTLLRTLAGLQRALSGKVELGGVSLTNQTHRQMARLVALVLTDAIEVDQMTVRELVSLGRTPFRLWFKHTDETDREIIDRVLSLTHIEHLSHKPINRLSDGERQRTLIAKALAQETPIILLDEPTAHLDITGRIEVMQLLHRLSKEEQKVVLISTHELELALQTADRLFLMKPHDGITEGCPEDIVVRGDLDRTFHGSGFRFDPHTGSFLLCPDRQTSVTLLSKGEGFCTFWTERALARCGYMIAPDSSIVITVDERKPQWIVDTGLTTRAADSIEKALRLLQN